MRKQDNDRSLAHEMAHLMVAVSVTKPEHLERSKEVYEIVISPRGGKLIIDASYLESKFVDGAWLDGAALTVLAGVYFDFCEAAPISRELWQLSSQMDGQSILDFINRDLELGVSCDSSVFMELVAGYPVEWLLVYFREVDKIITESKHPDGYAVTYK